MEENLLYLVLSKIDAPRTKQSQTMFAQLEDDFESLQFVEISSFEIENLPISVEQPPGTISTPFVLLGETQDEDREVGVGLWQLSLN